MLTLFIYCPLADNKLPAEGSLGNAGLFKEITEGKAADVRDLGAYVKDFLRVQADHAEPGRAPFFRHPIFPNLVAVLDYPSENIRVKVPHGSRSKSTGSNSFFNVIGCNIEDI